MTKENIVKGSTIRQLDRKHIRFFACDDGKEKDEAIRRYLSVARNVIIS